VDFTTVPVCLVFYCLCLKGCKKACRIKCRCWWCFPYAAFFGYLIGFFSAYYRLCSKLFLCL